MLCRYLMLTSINKHWYLANELIIWRPLISRRIHKMLSGLLGCCEKYYVVNTHKFDLHIKYILCLQDFKDCTKITLPFNIIYEHLSVTSSTVFFPTTASTRQSGMLLLIRNCFLRRTLPGPPLTCQLPPCGRHPYNQWLWKHQCRCFNGKTNNVTRLATDTS